jgi:hypothetical protein
MQICYGGNITEVRKGTVREEKHRLKIYESLSLGNLFLLNYCFSDDCTHRLVSVTLEGLKME